MIIKKYNESKKESEILNQYNVLHVDSSEFSRYAIGSLLVRYDFIVKKFFSVKEPAAIPDALKTEEIDLLLINYSSCRYDVSNDLRKIKKQFPKVLVVIYNFSHSRFEKVQLLNAGVNALFDPDKPFEDMLFALQEIKSGSVFLNDLVDTALLKNIKTHLLDSVKDLDKEGLALVRDFCKGLREEHVMEKHHLTKAKMEQAMHRLMQQTGCENRVDFLRYAMLNKMVKADDKLIAEAELALHG